MRQNRSGYSNETEDRVHSREPASRDKTPKTRAHPPPLEGVAGAFPRHKPGR